MTLQEKLDGMRPDERAPYLVGMIKEGLESDFGEWVMTHIGDQIEAHYQALLREQDRDNSWKTVGGVQSLERLRVAMLSEVQHDETEDRPRTE